MRLDARALGLPVAPHADGPWGVLREPRIGIMLHYDGSLSDAGAKTWKVHPDCKVSYTFDVYDDGTIEAWAPINARAHHAGHCRPSRPDLRYRDANSAFYGIAVVARDGDTLTVPQRRGVLTVVRALATGHGWDLGREPWRLTSHRAECWPRRRKVDIEGTRTPPLWSPAGVLAALREAA